MKKVNEEGKQLYAQGNELGPEEYYDDGPTDTGAFIADGIDEYASSPAPQSQEAYELAFERDFDDVAGLLSETIAWLTSSDCSDEDRERLEYNLPFSRTEIQWLEGRWREDPASAGKVIERGADGQHERGPHLDFVKRFHIWLRPSPNGPFVGLAREFASDLRKSDHTVAGEAALRAWQQQHSGSPIDD